MTEHVHDFSESDRCKGCGTGIMSVAYKTMADANKAKHDKEHTRWPQESCRYCNPPVSPASLQREVEVLRTDNREVVAALQDSQLEVIRLNNLLEIMRDESLHFDRQSSEREGEYLFTIDELRDTVAGLRLQIADAMQLFYGDSKHGGSAAEPASGCLACSMANILDPEA